MFEEVGEQFHQFIASSRASLPISLPFPLHHATSAVLPPHTTFTTQPFDVHFSSHPSPIQLAQTHINHLPQLHLKQEDHHQDKESSINLFSRERSIDPHHDDLWSNDEVLALLKIRSGMESWFPDFTWEHVSRKLEDLGFKRSAEKCKEKYEEESRHFNPMSCNKNFRLFNELEVICQNDQNASVRTETDLVVNKLHNGKVLNEDEQRINNEEEEDSRNEIRENEPKISVEDEKKSMKEKTKKRRHREFETLKGFCEEIVRKMIARQEEMHNKIIEEMVKRDEEKIAKEEAWKKQESDRMNKELETRAQEQAIASERQTKLIEFLEKITSNASIDQSPKRANNNENLEVSNASVSSKPLNPSPSSNPSSLDTQSNQKVPTSSNEILPPQNPSSGLAIIEQKAPTKRSTQNLNLAHNEGDELGKRWPREEVLALIKLRGNIGNNNGSEDKEGLTNPRGPLWERVSQGMFEMGHKRSAKRCKEKWENINKYFRKTKDVRKRSLDSRTCPYFQELGNLYSQQGGSLLGTVDPTENRSIVGPVPERHLGSDQVGTSDAKMDVGEGEKLI